MAGYFAHLSVAFEATRRPSTAERMKSAVNEIVRLSIHPVIAGLDPAIHRSS
jgi:hypothetical protein